MRLNQVVRSLARMPGFTSIAVLTLAIGIGANAAIFSVIQGVLLKPLPYARPAEIVAVAHAAPGVKLDHVGSAPFLYFSYREDAQVFRDVGLWRTGTMSLTGFAQPEEVPTLFVTDAILPMLGAEPMLGRLISKTDDVVSESLAREFWNEPSAAVGKFVRPYAKGEWREVIGVVTDMRDDGLNKKPVPAVYWPLVTKAFVETPESRPQLARGVTVVVRSTRTGTNGFVNELSQAVWAINPNLPVSGVRTLQDIYDASLARTSFTLVMLGIAGGMALLLGVGGLYGVISYSVSQRSREIGIRIALGAQAGAVTRMFVRHGLALAVVGVAIGLAVALSIMRLMSSLLFDVSPIDPLTYVLVSGALIAATLLASYVPALRATSVDPINALRAE